MKKPSKTTGSPQFAVCIDNQGCDDLQVRKLYRILPDVEASKEGYLRIVDDSEEDYLYPAAQFVVVKFPEAVTKQLLAVGYA